MKFLLSSLLFISSSIVAPMSAQTITVRLINGATGKRIANKNITFRWNDDTSIEGTVVRIDKDGTGHVGIPRDAKTFTLSEGPNDGKNPYRIAYQDCNVHYPQRELVVADVLLKGIVPGNQCSKKTMTRNRAWSCSGD